MNKKFLSLETFRGFSALMIAAIHFDVNSPLVNHSLASGFFVHFFFTLSGFVIYHNYRDKIQNLNVLKKFVIKRFWRLYPLHLFFLIIFLIIEILKFYLNKVYGLEANNQAFSQNNTFSLMSNFFLVHTFLTKYTFNTPSWSISAEFLTYILFAIFVLFNKKTLPIILVASLSLIFRLNQESYFGASQSGYLSLVDCLYCFFCGIISYKIYEKIKKNFFYLRFQNLLSLLSILLMCVTLIYLNGKTLIILPIIFGITIFFSCETHQESILGKFLLNKFFLFLGKISYSIYMSHLFVFWMITQFCRFILKFETQLEAETGFTKIVLNTHQANLVVIFSYAITIIFSYFLYKFLENNYFYLRS